MLLDVQMPEMDGYEVARHARMNPTTRDVPIIFLTATHNSQRTCCKATARARVDFLFKPLDPDVLRSKVHIFLELTRVGANCRRQDGFGAQESAAGGRLPGPAGHAGAAGAVGQDGLAR